MDEALLNVKNLTVSFKIDEGYFKAVDNISFAVNKGETVGIVGESGAGKSVTALSIPGLIPSPPAKVEEGEILFNDSDLLKTSPKKMRKIRGNSISMIFQEPTTALSPLHRVGAQMVETLRLHRKISKKSAWKEGKEWLKKVGISDPSDRMYAYPFQLSGGMQQRIMIAMALMLSPDLIIADEPTTALDVTIQAQIFNLIREMKEEDTSMLLITHDMGVVWEMCDRVIVMYASEIVEEGHRNEIFDKPTHPYTIGLLNAIPKLSGSRQRMTAIEGQVPSPLNYPIGCRFSDRCPYAEERCRSEKPGFVNLSGGHRAACFFAGDDRFR